MYVCVCGGAHCGFLINNTQTHRQNESILLILDHILLTHIHTTAEYCAMMMVVCVCWGEGCRRWLFSHDAMAARGLLCFCWAFLRADFLSYHLGNSIVGSENAMMQQRVFIYSGRKTEVVEDGRIAGTKTFERMGAEHQCQDLNPGSKLSRADFIEIQSPLHLVVFFFFF